MKSRDTYNLMNQSNWMQMHVAETEAEEFLQTTEERATKMSPMQKDSRTMAAHVRFESLHISLPSSAKQQRGMTKSYVVLKTCIVMTLVFLLN